MTRRLYHHRHLRHIKNKNQEKNTRLDPKEKFRIQQDIPTLMVLQRFQPFDKDWCQDKNTWSIGRHAFSYVHVFSVWLSAAVMIQQAWSVAQNAPLCGRFVPLPRDLHFPYILSFRTQTSHRLHSCTDLQFNRFVIYITSLSLFDGAEHKPCESSLFWMWLIPSWFSCCLSLTLRVPCALYSTNSKKKKKKDTRSQDVQPILSPEGKPQLYI